LQYVFLKFGEVYEDKGWPSANYRYQAVDLFSVLETFEHLRGSALQRQLVNCVYPDNFLLPPRSARCFRVFPNDHAEGLG
jgi:hypothetical protein